MARAGVSALEMYEEYNESAMVRRRLLTALALLPTTGCGFIYDRLYYASMEKLGREKRDILAKRVANSRKDQEQAKEQFQTTLEAFQ
jgi:hypothetical protein